MKEVTCVKFPKHAHYLRRDRIIIESSNGCHIVDPITDKIIRKICNTCPTHIAVHPDKKKIALSSKKMIQIYSYDHVTNNIKKIWSWNNFPKNYELYTSIFSPFDETIITRHAQFAGFMKHNYTTNKSVPWNNPYSTTLPPKIAFHRTQQIICLAHSSGCISVHKYNGMNEINTLKIENYHYFCEYNFNSSIIACGNRKSLYIVCPDTKQEPIKKHLIGTDRSNAWWDCIAFHPNGAVLTTLSSPNSVLCHWDIKTCQPIDTIPLLPDNNDLSNPSLSFLPNGIELMITLGKKCIIIPISLNVIYPPSTRKKLYYLLFLLKNYTLYPCAILPKDIITLLMDSILAVFKC